MKKQRTCEKCAERKPHEAFSRCRRTPAGGFKGRLKCDDCKDQLAAAIAANKARQARARKWEPWTAQQDALLAEAVSRGMSRAQAAVFCGRDVKSVRYRRRKLGLPHFSKGEVKWPPPLVLQLAQELTANGRSYAAAGARLGVTRGSVAGAVRDRLSRRGGR